MITNLNRYSWEEIAAMDPADITYILPIGSLEQHGRHLPLGTDDFILKCAMEQLYTKEELPSTMMCLPTLHYGNSHEHLAFRGTISFSNDTLVAILRDILKAMQRHGVKKLVVINSHGGNTALLEAYAQEWEVEYGVKVYTLSFWSPYFFRDMDLPTETPLSLEIHAGELETSILQNAMPDVVHEDRIAPQWDAPIALKDYYTGWLTHEISPDNGTMGVPSKASKEKGQQIIKLIGDKLCNYLLEIQNL